MNPLENILQPVKINEFLEKYWGKVFHHESGISNRYCSLFDWDLLNKILTEQRFLPPRLRLFMNGRRIDPYLYQHREPPFLLKSEEFIQQLNNGATIILDGIDEVHTPLRELSMVIMDQFRAPVNINLYVGWKQANGFSMHFDTQENLILQLYGKKHWKVWKPTREYPIQYETSAMTEPGSDLIWDGILYSGGWFYIPRGWWHIAYPVDEPSMHITITITPYRGTDILNWITERCKDSLLVRKNIPVVASDTDRRAYLEELLSEFRKHFSSDIVDVFLQEKLAKEPKYPELHLPHLDLNVKS